MKRCVFTVVNSCGLFILLSHPRQGQGSGILFTTRTSWHLFCGFTRACTHCHRKSSWGLLFQSLCSFYILSPLTHIMGCLCCFPSLLLAPTPLSSYQESCASWPILTTFCMDKARLIFAYCLSEGLEVVLHPLPSPGEFASTIMFRFPPLPLHSIAKTRMVHDTL